MIKLKVIVYSSLGVLASLYLTSCQSATLSPSTQSQQFYEVNGAKVCDYQQITPTIQDDCNQGTGYYYNPGTSMIFYRSTAGKTVIVQRNVPRSSIKVGGTLPLTQPVITNRSGIPVLSDTGTVVRSPSRSAPSITTTPVRSTASFEAPGVRSTAGKATGGTSRGLSIGGSSSRGSVGG